MVALGGQPGAALAKAGNASARLQGRRHARHRPDAPSLDPLHSVLPCRAHAPALRRRSLRRDPSPVGTGRQATFLTLDFRSGAGGLANLPRDGVLRPVRPAAGRPCSFLPQLRDAPEHPRLARGSGPTAPEPEAVTVAEPAAGGPSPNPNRRRTRTRARTAARAGTGRLRARAVVLPPRAGRARRPARAARPDAGGRRRRGHRGRHVRGRVRRRLHPRGAARRVADRLPRGRRGLRRGGVPADGPGRPRGLRERRVVRRLPQHEPGRARAVRARPHAHRALPRAGAAHAPAGSEPRPAARRGGRRRSCSRC